MAEYNEIMAVAETKKYLRDNVINSSFAEKFINLLKDFIDFCNISGITYEHRHKSFLINIPKDEELTTKMIDKLNYNIALAFMTMINDPNIMYTDSTTVKHMSLRIKNMLAVAISSAPYAMSLYNVLFDTTDEKYNTVLIVF